MSKAKTDQQVIAERDDREYLSRTHLWPGQTPTKCYVKRSPSPQGWRETGPCVLWGLDPLEFVVQVHHWQATEAEPTPHATERIKTSDLITVVRYDSVDDVLADGWIVD